MDNIDNIPERERHKSLNRQNTYEEEGGGSSPMGIKERGRIMSRSVNGFDGELPDNQRFNDRIQSRASNEF